MRWAFQARTAVRSGVAYADAKGTPTIFFGDARANVYAVNGETGRLIWIVRPQEPREALATAAPRYYKGAVYQPFSSYEELLAAGPNYHCCTFRGNVVALDAGHWQDDLADVHDSRNGEVQRKPGPPVPRELLCG
jgi:polyvinyl alcohol dehydrogenase (cytochrome)